jgi:hypothetical protein
MKTLRQIALGILVIGLTQANSCYKSNGDVPDIPVLPYNEPIENPPDEFLIVFNLTTPGDRVAEVTFAENSVWEIEKRGDGKANLFIKYNESLKSIQSIDTIGFAGEITYLVIMNNNNYADIFNYFVGFTKLDIAYDDFESQFP